MNLSRQSTYRSLEGPAHRDLSRPIASKPFMIRTSTTRTRNPFRFRTSLERPDLRIPKDLRSAILSRNSFIFCTYRHAHKCGKQTTYNPFKIRTYQKRARNPFRIRTYKKPGGDPCPSQCADTFPIWESSPSGLGDLSCALVVGAQAEACAT
jgi:hypothetical protein